MSHRDSLENRRFFLRKKERLRSKLAFEYLFEHGSRFSVGVLRFFYAFDAPPRLSPVPLSVAVTAPKRSFKHAVDRNLLKRRMREAFRLNKHIILPLLIQKEKNLIILVKYNPSRITPYEGIHQAMVSALRRIEKELNKS
ncbi:MAG: ribonuclease P protein component [Bacteroidia bacterium]|nr:ribonuclease P protein component [Bacteroidia bacterium]